MKQPLQGRTEDSVTLKITLLTYFLILTCLVIQGCTHIGDETGLQSPTRVQRQGDFKDNFTDLHNKRDKNIKG